ncbi:MAG: hypothetical protein JXA57_11265 [Armatimonadetes bacterium]|nr:hypothetical protein [Armatimonadota bacterium]
MEATDPHIDPYLVEQHLKAFVSFVQDKSDGVPFVFFAANPYTDKQEGYKAQLYREARTIWLSKPGSPKISAPG